MKKKIDWLRVHLAAGLLAGIALGTSDLWGGYHSANFVSLLLHVYVLAALVACLVVSIREKSQASAHAIGAIAAYFTATAVAIIVAMITAGGFN